MMPYAANPYVFKPTSVAEGNYIGFIGSVYGARVRHIENIVTGCLPIQVYGNNQQAQNYKSSLYVLTRLILPWPMQKLKIKLKNTLTFYP